MTAFQAPLDAEVEEYRETRVNALPSLVGERAAAIRYDLDRVDENVCDGYATDESPLEAGTPVEIKSVRVDHGGQRTGRVGIHTGSHEELLELEGVYAIVLYAEIDVDGDRVVVLESELVGADDVDEWVSAGSCQYQKVRWDLLLDDSDVDRARWSA